MDIIGLVYGVLITITFIFVNIYADIVAGLVGGKTGIIWVLHIFGPTAIIGAIISNYYVMATVSATVGSLCGYYIIRTRFADLPWLSISILLLSLFMFVRCIVYFVRRYNHQLVNEEDI
uniref:Uncharacterized protein n=1 Tax=Acrobeloides nanus TaxID=290746 RepID=A0A914DJH8_9BILA